jgi:DNA-binding MarR family transcriptional regulator
MRENRTRSVCSYGALRRAMRGVGQLYDQALLQSGINASQYNVLSAIRRLHQPSQSELAEELVMDLSALGHTLKPLVRDGFVALERDALDGRKRRVVLTREGQDKFDEAHELWKPAQKNFDAALGAVAGKEFREMLDHLVSHDFGSAYAKAARRQTPRTAA